MKIVRYSSRDEKAWETFIDASANGTIFHRRAFLKYHPKGHFEDHSYIFCEKGEIVAVLPAARIGETLFSHPGASYGGLVVRSGIGLHSVLRVLELLRETAANEGFTEVRLKLVSRCYEKVSCDNVRFALVHLHGTHLVTELECVIPLDFAIDKGIVSYARNGAVRAIRKARKQVVFRESDDFETYWWILAASLKARHRTEPTHTLDEIQRLKRIFPDGIKLFGAFSDEVMLGGIVVFACNPTGVLAFYIAQDYTNQQKRPTNLLVNEISKWARMEGFRYFSLGISTEEAGTLINDGLFRFKESHGALGVVREQMVFPVRP